MLEKLTDSDLTLDTGTTVIRPVKCVRDLGVHLDSELTIKTHISKVVSSCYHQLRRIRQVGQDVAQQLISAFIFIATRLLQLTVVSSANYSASATCGECSRSSHNELVVARPCQTSFEAATLAAGRAQNYIQAVSVHARTTSTSDRHHNTCQTVCPQLLKPVADTG